MNLSKEQRRGLWLMFGGKCAYCACDLPEKGWHADHVEPVHREWWKSAAWWKERNAFRWEFDESEGRLKKIPVSIEPARMERPQNDRLDNLFPSCRACNIDKHASSLEDWRASLERKPQVLRDNYAVFRHAERFGLVSQVKTKVVFYFEQLAAEQFGNAERIEA